MWLATSVLYLFCCVLAIVCVYFFYLRRYVQERGRPINLSAAVCCQIKSEKLKIVTFDLVSYKYKSTNFWRREMGAILTLNVSFDILIFASMSRFWSVLETCGLICLFFGSLKEMLAIMERIHFHSCYISCRSDLPKYLPYWGSIISRSCTYFSVLISFR